MIKNDTKAHFFLYFCCKIPNNHMKFSIPAVVTLLFALSINATPSTTVDPGTDQVPPIGLPPIKIPALDSSLPLNVRIDTEGNPIRINPEASESPTYSTLPAKSTPIRSAASKIGPCDTTNVVRCEAFKQKNATVCSSSSMGTACNTELGTMCLQEAMNACIDFTGANGLFCSAFGCGQYLD